MPSGTEIILYSLSDKKTLSNIIVIVIIFFSGKQVFTSRLYWKYIYYYYYCSVESKYLLQYST